uniref:Uncharacterized protein n=1 Tax=Tanacetum cinerariifolium TaxID=118510 RepID=A0A6L2LXZ1_TANCI|nr:hypothetical protein [Tanacetum cinerariifolium]
MTSSIYVEVPQVTSTQLLSPRQRQQILGTSSGLKPWCLEQCGFKNQYATTSMLSGEFLIRGANVNSSMDLLSIGSLLVMSTLNVETSLSLNSRLSSSTITSIWIGSRDGTLNDVRTALDDRLKGIQMKYLPQTIWRKSDKERAATMIQAIDKQLKTRRIMRSLERFVGGRLYEEDFKMLQWTI